MSESEDRLLALQEKLNYSFKNVALLKEALTHPSNGLDYSNQRLEFLGDSVVSTIISQRIFLEHKDMDEGQLSNLRSALTSGEYMAYLGEKLGLSEALILNDSLDALKIRKEKSAITDAFEALAGAVFLDSNFLEAQRVIFAVYNIENIDIAELLLEQNPKGVLQELAAKQQVPLEYILVEELGQDHEKMFRYKVNFRNMSISGELFSTKRKAQASAALNLLKKIK